MDRINHKDIIASQADVDMPPHGTTHRNHISFSELRGSRHDPQAQRKGDVAIFQQSARGTQAAHRDQYQSSTYSSSSRRSMSTENSTTTYLTSLSHSGTSSHRHERQQRTMEWLSQRQGYEPNEKNNRKDSNNHRSGLFTRLRDLGLHIDEDRKTASHSLQTAGQKIVSWTRPQDEKRADFHGVGAWSVHGKAKGRSH